MCGNLIPDQYNEMLRKARLTRNFHNQPQLDEQIKHYKNYQEKKNLE